MLAVRNKKEVDKVEKPWVLIAVFVIFAVGGQLLLKKGVSEMGKLSLSADTIISTITQLASQPLIYVGLASWVISAFIWLIVISKSELSFSYPISVGVSFILLLIITAIFFSEQVTLSKLFGVATILAGIIIATN